MFKNIFVELLQKRGISAYKLSKDIEVSEAVISQWKNGTALPKYDSIKKLSKYLKVSSDYLLEIEDNKPSIENSNIANVGGTNTININKSENVSYLEMELIQEIKKLSKAEQIKLLEQLNKE